MPYALLSILVLTATPSAETVLKKVDAATNQARDAVMTLEVSVSMKGSDPLKRTLKIWQLGVDKRMVKFLAPSRLRGTGILVSGKGQTHLYLPAYKRVRRVVGKQGSGSFMGMGFSINDLARVQFSNDYVPEHKGQTPAEILLKLTPKNPGAHKHASLRLHVRKSDYLVTRIVALDKSGAIIRTIVADQFKVVGKYTLAHRIRIDEVSNGKQTIARLLKTGFDQGLSERHFTERQLKRAP